MQPALIYSIQAFRRPYGRNRPGKGVDFTVLPSTEFLND